MWQQQQQQQNQVQQQQQQNELQQQQQNFLHSQVQQQQQNQVQHQNELQQQQNFLHPQGQQQQQQQQYIGGTQHIASTGDQKASLSTAVPSVQTSYTFGANSDQASVTRYIDVMRVIKCVF